MNIPKEVIEKAIEGGWKGDLRYKTQYPEIKRGSGDVLIWYVDTVSKEWTFDRLSFQEIALDPTFWQALGKSFDWCIHEERYDDGLCAFCFLEDDMPEWKKNALEFIAFILTDGDTAKFWQELLDKETK